MKHYTKRLSILMLLFTCALSIWAQAFDGDFDRKIVVGYLNYGGKSGGELGVDKGLNDYLSYHITLRIVDSDPDWVDEKNFLNGCDAVLGINYHFQGICHLPSNFDFYAGPNISVRSHIGAEAGIRYNFGEVVGAYLQGYYNITKVLKFDDEDDSSPFDKKWGVSVGLNFNI